jgi:hypothetical protein
MCDIRGRAETKKKLFSTRAGLKWSRVEVGPYINNLLDSQSDTLTPEQFQRGYIDLRHDFPYTHHRSQGISAVLTRRKYMVRQSFSVADDSFGLDEFHHPPIRIFPAVAGLFIAAERCESVPVRIVDIDGARAQIGGHLPCVVKILG